MNQGSKDRERKCAYIAKVNIGVMNVHAIQISKQGKIS